ncbi:unnamed protein product, partial [marine sediment metagenome]
MGKTKSSNFNEHRVFDAVHGTIGLSALEREIIDTRLFQRLRNIKHLGLTYLVFPDADFSRFSHSLGVCHLTGQILESLIKNSKKAARNDFYLSPKEIQKYRLAGLL